MSAIAFDGETQRAVYQRVGAWLAELFGASVTSSESAPIYSVTAGSACVTVCISAQGNDEATISTRATVVGDVELAPDLLLYLLQRNDELPFGAFGVDDEGSIFVSHTIVGSTLDKPELVASLRSIITIADRYDDIIVARWGGQRALERKR